MAQGDPPIIQGGMGVAVSDWRLANAVSRLGQLGVVSGTAIGTVLSRRLQLGDPQGHCRRALHRFPHPSMVERILEAYFIPGGKAGDAPFRPQPLPTLTLPRGNVELLVVAAFVEVLLAKEGHAGLVGINLLEKLQLMTLATLYGAMLAGADYVLMGAGIPRQIPGALDRFARGERADLRIDIDGAKPGEEFLSSFDPTDFLGRTPPALPRPRFLAIVSSAVLAQTLARKSNGRVDGFVIELDTAGGHNAPPRGPLTLTPSGEPVYGPRDAVDLEAFRSLGLPFWLAGSYARPGKLAQAQAHGAVGVQVGTAFAFCDESGIEPGLKRDTIRRSRTGEARVFTDPRVSPTGFPFKVLQAPGTIADAEVYEARPRLCDLGGLRRPYRRDDGTLGYRCPAEPTADFLRKGGAPEDVDGRKCVCNGLLATVGLAQVRPSGYVEAPLMTAGNDVTEVFRCAAPGCDSYGAADVVHHLLEPVAARA